MFRCPSCAKVHKLKLTNNHSLLISRDMDRLWIAKEPIRLVDLHTSVENDLAAVAKALEARNLALDLKEDNSLECVCCGEWNTFEQWNHAWKFPGDFFDADQICQCGGELWYDRVPGQNFYALVCEECGWVKKNKVISGAPSM